MGTRLELHELLKDTSGIDNVYFQPPPTLKRVFPYIQYERDYAKTIFADNEPYNHRKRYLITVVDPDPDSDIPDKIRALPMCVFDRHYAADNLNHDVFKLFF